jgi:hypothetical protein
VVVEIAKGKRKCKGKKPHTDRTIHKESTCLRVKTGPLTSSVYCNSCAKEILANAEKKLKDLVRELGE